MWRQQQRVWTLQDDRVAHTYIQWKFIATPIPHTNSSLNTFISIDFHSRIQMTLAHCTPHPLLFANFQRKFNPFRVRSVGLISPLGHVASHILLAAVCQYLYLFRSIAANKCCQFTCQIQAYLSAYFESNVQIIQIIQINKYVLAKSSQRINIQEQKKFDYWLSLSADYTEPTRWWHTREAIKLATNMTTTMFGPSIHTIYWYTFQINIIYNNAALNFGLNFGNI